MKLCVRQICFLFAAVLPVTRLLVYPATLSFWAKNDLLFAAGMSFVLEGAAVAAAVFLASRTQKTFFELLESNFGNDFHSSTTALCSGVNAGSSRRKKACVTSSSKPVSLTNSTS